jgi:hypothetical protein
MGDRRMRQGEKSADAGFERRHSNVWMAFRERSRMGRI